MLTTLFRRPSASEVVGPRTGPHGRTVKSAEEKARTRGAGNWACWEADELDPLLAAAERWRTLLPPGDRFWLCWNNDDAWCRLQQRLVLEVGWTPVVGYDHGQVRNPTVLPGAIAIDFRGDLTVPDLWMHFPMEWAFAWVERLAFWHSDVLLPRPTVRAYARQFEQLSGPVTAAVLSRRNPWRPRGWNNADRCFEVVGCTTRAASRSQYDAGAGWWRHFQNHPNCPSVPDLYRYHWDHGGVYHWERARGGTVCRLRFEQRFHFSHYHRPDVRKPGQSLAAVDLARVTAELGIANLLDR